MSRRKTESRLWRKRRSRRQNPRGRATNGQPPGSAASNGSGDGWIRHGTALPSWTDLEPSRNRRRHTSDDSFLEKVSTGRFAVLLLAIAGVFTLYVGHVHATTDLLDRLQDVRAENRRLHLEHNRLKGEYDRQTGPSVIYERAQEMGLRASVRYGPPVSVE